MRKTKKELEQIHNEIESLSRTIDGMRKPLSVLLTTHSSHWQYVAIMENGKITKRAYLCIKCEHQSEQPYRVCPECNSIMDNGTTCHQKETEN